MSANNSNPKISQSNNNNKMPPTLSTVLDPAVNSLPPNQALCFDSAAKALLPAEDNVLDANDTSVSTDSHNSSVTVPMQLLQNSHHG